MNKLSRDIYLNKNWQVFYSRPGAISCPAELDTNSLVSGEITVPSSLASFDNLPCHKDAIEEYDWWYETRFDIDGLSDTFHFVLYLESLASLCDVWLNDVLVLSSSNFFVKHEINVDTILKTSNKLNLHFKSLSKALSDKKGRPRWKTNLIQKQQLRWFRTTLLGRMTGWSGTDAPLGPCGDIVLKQVSKQLPLSTRVVSFLQDGKGIIEAEITSSCEYESAFLCVDGYRSKFELVRSEDTNQSQHHRKVRLVIDQPKLWWPSTHGAQDSYQCAIELIPAKEIGDLERRNVETAPIVHSIGKRYFADFAFDLESLKFTVNGKEIFVRGACWTHADIKSFNVSEEMLRKRLILFKQAGMNMLRVGGTMSYESDLFYQLCDELGIMVWQDFMFANMDYPFSDAEFYSEVNNEVTQTLEMLSSHPCVACYCGNSEVQQQAAMLGLPKESWSNNYFDSELPELCEKIHPNIPYFPSTPSGGALPFYLSEGLSHFYGVGAYKKSPLASGMESVKFSPECLAFSHVPSSELINSIFESELPACHHPNWKAGVPRDRGAGWDFEDTRDFYFKELFHLDSVTVRSQDTEHYLALSRCVPGEMMTQVFSRWRLGNSRCAGALIWQYNDVLPGAGWGVIDSTGEPKSSYYYLKRLFQPVNAYFVNEELNGLTALLVNEKDTDQPLSLVLKVVNSVGNVIRKVEVDQVVSASSTWQQNVDELFGQFIDANFSYQFGASQHKAICLEAYDVNSVSLLSHATYVIGEHSFLPVVEPELSVKLVGNSTEPFIELKSSHLLHSVHLELKGLKLSDNYFTLIPDCSYRVALLNLNEHLSLIKGYLSALNLYSPIRIKLEVECLNDE